MEPYRFSLKELIDHDLSPVQAVLQASVDLVSSRFALAGSGSNVRAPLLEHRGEVDANGAFLGAIAAFGHAINDRMEEFPADQWGPCTSVSWAQYTNHYSGRSSEPQRGGDFALVLDLGGNHCRLAIFQSKVAKSAFGKRRIALTQHTGKRVQLVQLAKTAVGVQSLKRTALNWKNLDWVHYLAWDLDKRPATVPLSNLAPQVRLALEFSINNATGASMPRSVRRALSIEVDWDDSPLDQLLNLGSANANDAMGAPLTCRGWLTLTYSQAERVVPPILKIMDVAVLHSRPGSPEFIHTLRQRDEASRQMHLAGRRIEPIAANRLRTTERKRASMPPPFPFSDPELTQAVIEVLGRCECSPREPTPTRNEKLGQSNNRRRGPRY
ncbi:hypothetical protein FJU31_06095 [Stenotrophomonas cyclobalanopsidis]|uniref:Uncharacterized protein n=1 Tax=Stenotrophomonas cyclobalanopsidis TaxID=2771362 RepID=A0ABQ6T3C7_9GAMM|nr:hypothetical protein [Stenotrophomonas cyclobalanopsidis]KAA9001523.1 hypothetical protein FJU31_06095 [Stenotrophomonas cyclobalanopsidis]